ncbi:uncharacterized protein [Dendrobates tinctorius]|uniref:uncharacterized protein n=1 Tax=Dendrobates tinctorius TaxID=92724 RepID=UPI003CC9810F
MGYSSVVQKQNERPGGYRDTGDSMMCQLIAWADALRSRVKQLRESPTATSSSSSSADGTSEGEEQEQRSQVPVVIRNVPQRDEDVYLDNEQLISLVQERSPLWDSRDRLYKDIVVTRRLWNEVAAALMDGWDSATASSKKAFMDKVRTRWRSIKDHFNSDVRAEGQVRSGSASRTRTRYRHYHALQFLRPVLATRSTWSSTLQPGPGAVLPRTSSDPSQPSDSQEAPCRSATHTAGDQEAGPSGVPLSQVSATGYAGTTRQRQRALDRNVLPEFMHLSEAFNSSLKSLSDRVESGFALMERGFNHFERRFNSVEQRLDRLEADLNRPAHHFFSKTEKGMAEHLSPEQQLNVLQACNNAFLQAMQHNQYGQQSVVSFPPVPPLTRFTSLPTCAAYHCTDTSIQSQDTHHYTTTSLSAAGHFTDTTMASAAPVWSTTATPMHAWSSATTRQTWNSPAATTTCSSPATTTPQTWTITAATSPPARTSTANEEQQQQPPQQQPPQQQPPQQQQQPPQQQQQPPQQQQQPPQQQQQPPQQQQQPPQQSSYT